VVISDGKILFENLRKNNLNNSWLENKLREQGVHDVSNVFLASLATDGSLYVDLKKQLSPNKVNWGGPEPGIKQTGGVDYLPKHNQIEHVTFLSR